MAEESATVKINGDGEPVVVEEIPAQEEHQDDDQEAKWRPAYSEMSDQLKELKKNQETEATKFSEFRKETADQIAELKARPQSTPQDSPPEPTPDPNPKNPTEASESNKPEKTASDGSAKPEEKPAAEKFRTVIRRRRSI
jgi:hypothetical protein